MDCKRALGIVTEEIIESHARCHIPYRLTVVPTTLQVGGRAVAGVGAVVDSDAFGRIASASAPSLEAVLKLLSAALLEDRKSRWADETGRMQSRAA